MSAAGVLRHLAWSDEVFESHSCSTKQRAQFDAINHPSSTALLSPAEATPSLLTGPSYFVQEQLCARSRSCVAPRIFSNAKNDGGRIWTGSAAK